jgi:hypothetical protein
MRQAIFTWHLASHLQNHTRKRRSATSELMATARARVSQLLPSEPLDAAAAALASAIDAGMAALLARARAAQEPGGDLDTLVAGIEALAARVRVSSEELGAAANATAAAFPGPLGQSVLGAVGEQVLAGAGGSRMGAWRGPDGTHALTVCGPRLDMLQEQ